MRFILKAFFLLAMPVIVLVILPQAGFAQSPAGKSMELTSPVFKQGEMIPDQYTCKGANISPPLSWKGVPGGTKSFTLIVDDPDAPKGIHTHWVAYNIDSIKTSLPENLPKGDQLDGLMQGKNDSSDTGYSGPCPPKSNGPHRYYFRIFALDSVPDLQPGADKTDVRNAMKGHILAEGELMGRYEIK